MMLPDNKLYPNLSKLVSDVLGLWLDHAGYLGKSLADRDGHFMRHSERLSDVIVRLSATVDGGLPALAADYRFLCEKIVLPEELHFRRTGSYRLKNFEEALRTVYNDTPFMTRYMNGLLVSDVLWANHCRAMLHFNDNFLGSFKPGAELLEIGPGHGLLLYLASETPNIAKLSAWDVSDASLDMSKHALGALGTARPVKFSRMNIFEPSIMEPKNANLFDAVVLSEVLEHLEHPEQAVRVLLHICKPGGRVWINVPANSPAPDHLYLVRDLKDAVDLVKGVGFDVVDSAQFPMTGVTLERAVRQKLTISCIVVGEKPLS